LAVAANAARIASICAGWIAHLPSKPSSRATRAEAVTACASRNSNDGPSTAATPPDPCRHQQQLLRDDPPSIVSLGAAPAQRSREVRIAEDQCHDPLMRGDRPAPANPRGVSTSA
jgi:hypothetical protein